MTSGELTPREERQLRECYAALHELAATCSVPSVRTAARAAVAEVHVALDGQALDFEMYTHRWLAEG
ncbi:MULTISPECIES: DUF6052 family protein [Actinokineospora]|uniref:Uncharacterized protein n=1 Tax=Actinokineospora fastidiosa TaxID=1816 RepID=A0A918LJQ4_9PSEU|nr:MULTISPECIES: DUF6052 family protein [Actinokineospora]UVS81492.1 hypothetical protein Actkin_05250 [Actinokineospora sp. UTMC 2448]GGS57721.1 hypothetical protein GCM10010171_60880 [Actinokineospora fastidiosa]